MPRRALRENVGNQDLLKVTHVREVAKRMAERHVAAELRGRVAARLSGQRNGGLREGIGFRG